MFVIRWTRNIDMDKSKCLFPHFLESRTDYHRARHFWRSLTAGMLVVEGLNPDEWTEAYTWHFADGTEMRDGNPIYSLQDSTGVKRIRIIQQDPNDDDSIDMRAWVDENLIDERTPKSELVVMCKLNVTNLEKTITLIRRWLTWDVDSAQFWDVIESTIDSHS